MVKRNLILFLILGSIYILLEVGFDILTKIINLDFSMEGKSSLWMFLVGGISALFIGKMNENKITRSLPIWIQCFIGTTVILLLEFITGYYCNIIHDWNLWSYYDTPLNLYGQICLPFAILWYFMVPFGIWMDDILNHLLFDSEEKYPLKDIYKALFKGEKFL